jgi:hypothetical protein
MAGTTNAQQWNPTQANQETDAAYTADAQRSGGAVDLTEFPSALANKLFYQVSTYITALGTMLANKGYSNNDANLANLTTVMANLMTSADLAWLTAGFSFHIGAGGSYVKLPAWLGGIIVQWGQNFSAPGVLTFPTQFTNAASISVHHIQQFTSGGTARICMLNNDSGGSTVTTATCFLNVSNDANISVNWIAIGV